MVVNKRKTKTSKKKQVVKRKTKTTKKKISTKRRTTREYLKKKKGGERHNNAIRKNDNQIILENGFYDLKTNGDYHIIHAYDETIFNSKQSKLDQLLTMLTTTFPMIQNDSILLSNQDEMPGIIYKVWLKLENDNERKNLVDIIKWLNDPKDN